MNSTSDTFTTSTSDCYGNVTTTTLEENLGSLLKLARSVAEMLAQTNKLCGETEGFLRFLQPSLLCRAITPDKNYDFIPNIRMRRLMPADKVIYIKRKRRKA